jgi:transcriptional regulator with XRE-family HTH domain
MGGPGSGNTEEAKQRRRLAAELKAQGMSLAEIGRLLKCTKQAVYQLLRPPVKKSPRAAPLLACAADLGPVPSQRDLAPALCLPCLARRPRATPGQRLRAHRIARRLKRRTLARLAGVGAGTVLGLERGRHRPRPGTLRKLAAALGVEPGELLPGNRRRG